MLTIRSHADRKIGDPTEKDQGLAMGEAVAMAFEESGGKLRGISREALTHDLAAILEPLLNTCTNAEWIKAINAHLDRLEGEKGRLGPRLERFGHNGIAEMMTPLQ